MDRGGEWIEAMIFDSAIYQCIWFHGHLEYFTLYLLYKIYLSA